MTHSRYFKKVAQKLDRLSLSANYEEYIKTLSSVREMCDETIKRYESYRDRSKDDVIKGDNTDNLVVNN